MNASARASMGPYTARRLRPGRDLIPGEVWGAKGGGGKSKGGGASSTQATVTPDTLATRSTARLIDIYSEGPVGGLLNAGDTADGILASCFADGTPIANADGSRNFKGVRVKELLGTPDQAYVPGFPDVEGEKLVGVEFTTASPVTRTITDAEIDRAIVKVRIDSLMLITDNGSVTSYTVQYAIDLQANGGSFVEIHNVTLKEKFGSPAEFEYPVELPRGGNPWLIRARRISPDDNDSKHQSKTTWSSYTQTIDAKVTYPFLAGVALEIDAQEFGSNIPSRAYRTRGVTIEVPANYDPIAKTYATVGPGTTAGLWDGTFKIAATENPAWWFRWLAIEKRYGAGDQIPEDAVDKWSLYAIAQYCDQLVPDGLGQGGMEPRFRFNYQITQADDALLILRSIASVFRGMAFWQGGAIVTAADMPSDPVRNVAPGNVVDGMFNYEGTADRSRHTVAVVTWNDPSDGFKPTVSVVEDPDGIAARGVIPLDVLAYGCTHESQAFRMGAWALDSEKHETETVSWTASYDQADLAPGQLVNIMDPDYAGVPYGGRLKEAAADQVTLDRLVDIGAADNAKLILTLPDLKLSPEITIAETGSVNVIAIDPPLAVAPIKGAMWIISSGLAAPRPFRVISIGEDDKNKFPITALQHDPTKFLRIEQNINLAPQNYSAIPTGLPLPPRDISIREYLYRAATSTILAGATIGWTPPRDPRVVQFEYQISPPGDVAVTVSGFTTALYVDLGDVRQGSMMVMVRALDALGRQSPWTVLNKDVFGINEAPATVTGFKINVLGDTAYFAWDRNTELNIDHYEIRQSPALDPDDADWNTSVDFLPAIDGTTVQAPAFSGTFLIKAITTQGKESAEAAKIASTVGGVLDFDVTETLQEDPSFAGVKDGVAVVSGTLRLTYARDIFADADWFAPADWFFGSQGIRPVGYYYFADIVDLGDVFTSRLTGSLMAGGVNLSADWFYPADVFAVADWFMADTGAWSVRLEMAFTQTDPGVSPAGWSDWQSFVVGDFTFRAVKFRIRLATNDNATTPAVSAAAANVNMPDRTIAENSLVIAAGGTRVDFTPPLQKFKGIGWGESNLAGAERVVYEGPDETGFAVKYHVGSTDVGRTISFVAKGYGRKHL